jgi:endogenous inhibitor of DNA gyrase (YacG/DUF329 family)
MAARCPTCKRDVLPRAQNPAVPFCSPRCREVDLGKWLGEEYRLADNTPVSEEDLQSMVAANTHVENEDEEP